MIWEKEGPGSSGPLAPATQEILGVTELCVQALGVLCALGGWGRAAHFLGAGYTEPDTPQFLTNESTASLGVGSPEELIQHVSVQYRYYPIGSVSLT